MRDALRPDFSAICSTTLASDMGERDACFFTAFLIASWLVASIARYFLLFFSFLSDLDDLGVLPFSSSWSRARFLPASEAGLVSCALPLGVPFTLAFGRDGLASFCAVAGPPAPEL